MVQVIGIVGSGDMGHAVGRALKAGGRRVLTALAGRSARSRRLSEAAGIEDAGGLPELMGAAELALSIVPPAAARDVAVAAAAAMQATGRRPHFVDCNAVSPATMAAIAEIVGAAGARVTDCGIIGTGPRPGGPATRFYVSGPEAGALMALDGNGIEVKPLGLEIGRASAMKMAYAGINKGALGLYAASLIAAERLGVTGELLAELAASQKATHERMQAAVPWLATDAERWIGEMEEIARTFASVGVTPRYHEGAADLYRLLAASPLSAETRESADRTRTLEEALRAFAAITPP
jgi:3-hydroxyisobutyrate dehydrogenase-like beta-hydroxyacid dehydrogenase